MQANLNTYILPYFDKLKTKDDLLKLIESEEFILVPLAKLIVYGELKQFEKARTAYLTILKDKTNPHFLERVKNME